MLPGEIFFQKKSAIFLNFSDCSAFIFDNMLYEHSETSSGRGGLSKHKNVIWSRMTCFDTVLKSPEIVVFKCVNTNEIYVSMLNMVLYLSVDVMQHSCGCV